MAISEIKTIDQLKSLLNEGMKSAMIRDAAGRPSILYEAHIEAEIGDPCLRTIYKYVDGAAGTSRKTVAWEETIVAWNGYEVIQVGAGNDINNLP